MSRPEAGPLRVGISGFDGLDNPQPGMAVAEALRAAFGSGVEIHALVYDPLATGAWMPGMADRLHLMPALRDGDEATLARLLALRAEHGLDLVLPCLDLDVPVYARLAARLRHAGIGNLLPEPESVYATGKLRLPQLCHDRGIPAPRTIHVLDLSAVTLHADQFGYPLMVKGLVAGAKRAGGAHETRMVARELDARWGGGVLLQEALAGEEFVVAGVMRGDGTCAGLVAARKLGVNENGKGVMGVVVDDPRLEAHARRVLEHLHWRGPVELELLRPHGAKEPCLLEVNARFPAWIRLAEWAGSNLAALVVEETRHPGRAHPPRPRAGTSFVRDVAETAVPLCRVRALARAGSVAGSAPAVPRNRLGDPDGARVAVSGLSTIDVVNAGLGTARALRRGPGIAQLYGLGYGAFDSGAYRAELFDAAYRLPSSDDPEALLERLREIHARTPFDCLLPCLDGEILRYAAVRDELEALGVRTLLPGARSFERRSKVGLADPALARDWGAFAIPDTVRAHTGAEVAAAVRALGAPVVVKGPVSHALRAGDADEARAAWARLRERGCTEALVQAHVAGERFAVSALCDRAHRCVASFTIKKLRVCERGSTWSGLRVEQPGLERAFAGFLRELAWTGPVEGEFIRDELDERFYLVEVNPRFTAWVAYTAQAGPNHPYLAVCAALGRDPEPLAHAGDQPVFMRRCEDVPVRASAFAAMATTGALRHA